MGKFRGECQATDGNIGGSIDLNPIESLVSWYDSGEISSSSRCLLLRSFKVL